MMSKRRTRDQELADNTHLLRAWKRWHREQLDEVLAGPHGAAVARVMAFLKHMDSQSASALVALAREFDWDQMDADVRLVILHEINTAIVKLCERAGLEPIDDPLPGAHANAFLRIKEHLFPRKAEKHAGDSPAKQHTQK
jgi:hypothetical protein